MCWGTVLISRSPPRREDQARWVFAPVAHLISGRSTRPEDVAWRLPERRAGCWSACAKWPRTACGRCRRGRPSSRAGCPAESWCAGSAPGKPGAWGTDTELPDRAIVPMPGSSFRTGGTGCAVQSSTSGSKSAGHRWSAKLKPTAPGDVRSDDGLAEVVSVDEVSSAPAMDRETSRSRYDRSFCR